MGHGTGVVINPSAIIGNNVSISQFTSIGSSKGKAATVSDCV
jgi:serine O-acetyltransferase